MMILVGDGTRYFMRGCALRGRVSRKQGRDCIERLGTWKTKMWYCQCDNKDGCNASSRTSTSSLTVLLACALFFYRWFSNVIH